MAYDEEYTVCQRDVPRPKGGYALHGQQVGLSDAEGDWLVKFRHTYDPKNMGEIELP